MVCASLAELAIEYKIIIKGCKSAWQGIASGLNTVLQKRGKSSPFLEKHSLAAHKTGEEVEDFALPADQVKTWEWALGLLVTVVVTCIICHVQFDMNAGLSILASILAFFFA